MRGSRLSRASIVGGLLLACAGLAACAGEGEATPQAGPEVTVETTAAVDDAGGAAGGGAAGMCVAAIEFEGETYLGVAAPLPEDTVGDTAGQAVTPPCNDTGDAGAEPSDPFPVLEIKGIDPSVAVATKATGTDGYWVWYVPEDASAMEPPAVVEELIDAAS